MNTAPFSTSCLGLSLLLIPWSDSSLSPGVGKESLNTRLLLFIFPFYFLSLRSCFVHVDSLRSGKSSRSIRAWRFGYWKLRENKNEQLIEGGNPSYRISWWSIIFWTSKTTLWTDVNTFWMTFLLIFLTFCPVAVLITINFKIVPFSFDRSQTCFLAILSSFLTSLPN